MRQDTQHFEALPLKPRRASLVMPDLVRQIMRGAINLDREVRVGAVEVEDVGTERVLTAEAQAANLSATQSLPEQNFG